MTNEKILALFKSHGDCTPEGIIEFANALSAEQDRKIAELEDLLNAALSLLEKQSS